MTDGRHGRPVLQLARLPLVKSIIYYCSRSQSGKWTLTAAVATGLIITATPGPAWPGVTSEHVHSCQAAVRRAPQRQFVQTEISDCCKSLLSCTPVQWGIGVTLAQMVGPLRLERCRTALSRECLFHCEYRVTVGYNQINEINESVSGIPGQGKGGKWGWGDQWWVSSAAGMPRQDVGKKERRRAGYSRLTQRHLIHHWQWLDFYLLLRACFMSKFGVFNDQGMDQFLFS